MKQIFVIELASNGYIVKSDDGDKEVFKSKNELLCNVFRGAVDEADIKGAAKVVLYVDEENSEE